MPTDCATLTAELARHQAACDAVYDNLATARGAIARSRKRIAAEQKRCRELVGAERQSIKAQRLVIDGLQQELAACRAAIKRIQRELRSAN